MGEKAIVSLPAFNYSFPFEKILKHNEFLKNYPNLAEQIKFTFYDNPSKTDGGKTQINDKGNQVIAINIGFKGDVNESIRSIGLHEIQHGIQGVSKAHQFGKLVNTGGTNFKTIYTKLKSAQNGGRGIVVYNRKGEKLNFSNFSDDDLLKTAKVLYQNNFEEIEARAVMQNNDMAKVMSELDGGFYYVADIDPNQNTVLRLKDTSNMRFSLSDEKPLRLPQTIARQTLDQMGQDLRNKVPTNQRIDNAIDFIQNTNWYNNLDDSQKARVNKTAIKSLLETAVKEINSLEDKIEDYKQQLKDNKLTARQVYNILLRFKSK